MKKLIQGIVEFRNKLTKENKLKFAKLTLGQEPDALFIACSDSRVVPNLFASTDPGDLFVLRNIGNLVPPAASSPEDTSVSAALEFSVFSINISDIIVCGHSECGAMKALAAGTDTLPTGLKSWLKHGEASINQMKQGHSLDPSLPEYDQLSQINVLEQIKHITSYPFIQERIEKKQLRIHGWWFDISKADVYCYEQSQNKFMLIDEKEANIILERLG